MRTPFWGRTPAYPRLFMAIGDSGHGLMLAPATGKALSELVRLGRSDTLDAAASSWSALPLAI